MTQIGCRCGGVLKKYSKFCSHSCANKYRYRKSYLVEKNCFYCNKIFKVIRYRASTAKFCSRICHIVSWSVKYKECVKCLSTKYKYKKNGLCSYCFNRLPINKIVWQNKNHKRRKYYQEGDININFLKQLWHDTTICEICLSPLPNNSIYPKGKHLDHLIPLDHSNPNYSKGTHSKNNVRYICAFCNIHRPHDGSDIAFNLQLHANNNPT